MIPSRIPCVGVDAFSRDSANQHRARAALLASRLREISRTHEGSPRGDPPSTNDIHFYSAPGRTELGGNHTDHNGGCVLAASVDLDMVAAARLRDDRTVTLHSEGYEALSIDIADLTPKASERGTPASIIRGIAAWIARRGLPACAGFDITMDSEVPAGSGLSSSAAFELLMAAIFDDIGGYGLSPREWALAGQFAENEYYGKPCGLMDQLACALGGITFIDFGASPGPKIDNLTFNFDAYGLALAIVATDSDHGDLTEEYAAIPREMKSVAALFGQTNLRGITTADLFGKAREIRGACGDRAFLRAWHFAHETARPALMAQALERSDIGVYLGLARASGLSSWTLLQNIHAANPKRQSLGVALALAEDIVGERGACRVHGGGFAGTIQAYIPEDDIPRFSARMEAVFGPGSVRRLTLRPFGVCQIRIESTQM